VGGGLAVAPGPQRGLDENQADPGGLAVAFAELAGWTDRRRVLVRFLEVVAPDCRESARMVGEVDDQVGATRQCPSKDLVSQRSNLLTLAAALCRRPRPRSCPAPKRSWFDRSCHPGDHQSGDRTMTAAKGST
jgi:hypothetical protein